MMKMRTRRALALAGSAIVLSAALSGCSALNNIIGGSNDAPRDEDTNEVVEESNIDIFSLKVGDCKMEDPSGEISDTDVVPCSDPHDEEVYFEFELEGDEFPESTAIDAEGEAKCLPAFEEYVGAAYDVSTLALFWITPTQETWDQLNDRVVQCVLYSNDGAQLTGSMKGTGV